MIIIVVLINKLLYCHGLWISSPIQTDGGTPLHTAARLGIHVVDNVQRMIGKQVVHINATNARHETPCLCTWSQTHCTHASFYWS